MDMPQEIVAAWHEGFLTACTDRRCVLEEEMEKHVEVQSECHTSAMTLALIDRGYSPTTANAFLSGFFYYDFPPEHSPSMMEVWNRLYAEAQRRPLLAEQQQAAIRNALKYTR